MTTRGLAAGAGELVGRVGGAVLAAIRASVDQTQEVLAEHLCVGLSTVQAWESGRRPLVNATFQDLQRLNRCLRLGGAAPELMYVLDQALLVDTIYADMVVAEPRQHPLTLIVPDRTLTELLAWPLTGEPPRQLRATKARLHVPTGVRDAVAADLRRTADRSAHGERGAMLRRQVKFLVADHAPSAEWLRAQVATEVRVHTDLRTWSPEWPVTRSQAVSAAHCGAIDPLRRFIDRGLAEDNGIEANLNYWAYWVGEHTATWATDADMMARPSMDWSGKLLLDSLVDGVVKAPYRELCIHTLWALLRRRSHLMRPIGAIGRITHAAESTLSTAELDASSRRRLEQVLYLAESAG